MNDRKAANAQSSSTRVPTEHPIRPNVKSLQNWRRSAGAIVAGELVSARREPDPRYFIGKGKLEELAQLIHDN